jgi:ribonucleoside-triphosphate reductase
MNIQWGPLGEMVFNRTYSRRVDDRHETWQETIKRVVRGNCSLLDEDFEPSEYEELMLEDLFLRFQALPAGRHLWVSGVEGRQYLFNCHTVGWGPRLHNHFTWLFSELLKGGGVGANYSTDLLDELPLPTGQVELSFCDLDNKYAEEESVALHLCSPSADGCVLEIPDSREGWVLALEKLIDESQNPGQTSITFDISKIRPAGSPILGFGGIASGPAPLIELLKGTAEILNANIGQTLGMLDCMSIDHQIASCVISGNVRRSARMSICHWNDPDVFDFIDCKLNDPTSHWTTNISVEIDDDWFEAIRQGDLHAHTVLEKVTAGMVANGEPGLFNSSLASEGERERIRITNPCGEIAMGEWSNCNLGHVNLAAFGTNKNAALEAARLMTRFLIRATFGDIESPEQKAVVERDRRIGVGLFGVQEWAAAHGVKWSKIHKSKELEMYLEDLRWVINQEALEYAEELGINAPIKTTTIAPTGTIAKLSGHSEGIHPIFAKHFIQRVRFAANDENLRREIEKGRHVEDCLYSDNTKVVSIPTRNVILDKFDEELIEEVSDINIHDLFAVQAFFQKHYANNAVSFTANIPENMKLSDLKEALWEWLPQLKGTTVFPDMSRPQSPYERINKQTFIELTGSNTQVETGQDFDECVSGACPVK